VTTATETAYNTCGEAIQLKRMLIDRLLQWKESPRRKPLILKGVRQVGKTWLLREFGRLAYDDVAYFNFENNKALSERFQHSLEPESLITELGIIRGKVIQPGRTLVILDEIQFCSEAITSLKYFQESAPEYHIVTAGSLLGIAMARPTSYPVGKVDVMTLRPMSFYEFLLANGEDLLVEHLAREVTQPTALGPLLTSRLLDYLKAYYITGGMPEAVSVWLATKDVGELDTVQRNILDLYALDFAKYAPASDIPKLSMIWNSIPGQLAKERGKFVYGMLKEGARAKAFEDAMMWLQNAGMVFKVHRIEKPGVPLKAYAKDAHFKLYGPDIGLLRRMAGLSARSITEQDPLYQEFKGVMAECFCLQEILTILDDVPFYWASGNQAEVDFVVQIAGAIVPIEVKSADNLRARSLTEYRRKYGPMVSVKASQADLTYADGVLVCPLYLLWKMPELVRAVITNPATGFQER
jgi:predicted AAA+ superfamily ATPase